MPPDHRCQLGLESLDIGAWKVTEEMEREVDAFDSIEPKHVTERLEGAKRPAQCLADGIRYLDGKENAPAFALIRHARRP
jgi:hypothetical protein